MGEKAQKTAVLHDWKTAVDRFLSTNLSQNIAQLSEAKTVRKLFICGPTE